MEKTYLSGPAEKKIYAAWEKIGAFKPTSNPDAQPFCIIMPPANVTGSLHLGHALTFTIQDILVRAARMQGKKVLWQPGTDHAGIATQVVVERQLAQKGQSRHDLGRDAFLEKVWAWKEESGGTIVSQLKRLGSSADWSRERFTMDPESNLAVLRVFVELYNANLIYRDKRLVNWDVTLGSALSDLEVNVIEEQGFFYYLSYALEDGSGSIIIATTRPETLFGDVAVAVNPNDDRYKHLIGTHVRLPLTERLIPIIADAHADETKGSGAVKITPGHDFDDFEVGKRHNLTPLNLLTPQGKFNENVPAFLQGLTPLEARPQVAAMLEEQGFMVKIEPRATTLQYSDRTGTLIEPYLTDQWFLNVETMAAEAIKAVEDGTTTFVPESWAQNYFEWMRNIQPWCISRQLWWGHRIPAWFGPDGMIFVALTPEEAHAQAKDHYGKDVPLHQDEDVLDTWFSSALWPFTSLGWPHDPQTVQTFYPTSVLVTGFDIIFFWVARMMMMGLYFMKEVPFKDVYIHALIRDMKGQKMSKSKGNVIDPLELIDEFGADALRFTLARLATPGRDIKLGKQQVESSRNFITKLWNAARYVLMNGATYAPDFDPKAVKGSYNLWIISEFHHLVGKINAALESYHIHVVAREIYTFTWRTYCDWYVEMTKPILQHGSTEEQTETRETLGWVLGQVLHILHPLTPFVTEEIWGALNPGASMLIKAPWPSVSDMKSPNAQDEINWTIDLITKIRALKTDLNIPAGTRLDLCIENPRTSLVQTIDRNKAVLQSLGRLGNINFEKAMTPELLKKCVQIDMGQDRLWIPIGDVVDVPAEKARLCKSLDKTKQDLASLEKRLSDPEFTKKAKAAIIEEAVERQAELKESVSRLEVGIQRLELLL